MEFIMTNDQLQTAIDSLLVHFQNRKDWCKGGSPDGALSQCLADLVFEQARRAKITNLQQESVLNSQFVV